MAIQVGQTAPDFKLYNTEKNLVSLHDFNGKSVLLLFFPLAYTGVCTSELCSVRDGLARYNDMDAEVIGISIDSLFVLDKFKEDNELNFTLLSDFNKEVAKIYDCLYDTFVFDMNGVAKRSAFVVDKEGKIQYVEVLENAGDLPDFDAIDAVLQKINTNA